MDMWLFSGKFSIDMWLFCKKISMDICVCDWLVGYFIIYPSKLQFQTRTELLFLGSDMIGSKFWTDRIGSEISRTIGLCWVVPWFYSKPNKSDPWTHLPPRKGPRLRLSVSYQ